MDPQCILGRLIDVAPRTNTREASFLGWGGTPQRRSTGSGRQAFHGNETCCPQEHWRVIARQHPQLLDAPLQSANQRGNSFVVASYRSVLHRAVKSSSPVRPNTRVVDLKCTPLCCD